ncbi:MAG TPA: NYN domain-containing protein [Myxococcota bacterium]|nr:NYN domain-containing protein [Myxococcota bacterium]
MEPSIAVLIDFENIAAGTEKEGHGKVDIGVIMNRLREKGRVLIARSYADWGRFARFKKALLFEGVTLFELSAHGMNDKNRADVAMVVDCMELALTKDYIDTYVVVSGDSDFTPLIQKLRELNKRVLGVGTRRSTSRLIVEACDEFIFYDTLRKQKTQQTRRGKTDSVRELSREEAMELVTEALAGIQRNDPKPVHASRIKEQILRKEPAFSESDLGFATFGRFMELCQKNGIVTLARDHKAGGYQVDSPDAAEIPAAEPLSELSAKARALYDVLQAEDLDPLTPALLAAVCEAIVADVEARKQKKRRVNLQWVTQDVSKTMKARDERVTPSRVKSLVNGLHAAGVFRHTDGEPIRSFFAAFVLSEDAAGLLRVLRRAMLAKLQVEGVELAQQTAALAELLYGKADETTVRSVEELIAWETAARESAPAEGASADAAPPKKPARKRAPRKKKAAPAAAETAAEAGAAETVDGAAAETVDGASEAIDGAAEATAEATAEAAPAKPKKKPARRKPRKKVEAAEDPAKPARKKPTRTVRRKKTEEAAPEA